MENDKNKHPFEKGNRVMFSEVGLRDLNPIKRNRLGTVIGFSGFDGCIRIQWDETNSGQTYHKRFLRLL